MPHQHRLDRGESCLIYVLVIIVLVFAALFVLGIVFGVDELTLPVELIHQEEVFPL